MMNEFLFIVSDTLNEIQFSDNERASFNEPSGLAQVRLLTHWWNQEYEVLDFTGKTKLEAIISILSFYEDENFRVGIGDHVFYEGFETMDGVSTICLGS